MTRPPDGAIYCPSCAICASFSLVDHPCHQCGATVEDGRPFCPHCRAPQVRVLVAEPPEPVLATAPDLQAAPDPLERLEYRSTTATGLFRVALQAGLLGMIANVIPFGMLLTGILAALLYHRVAGQTLTTGRAVRLGAMAGAVASSAFLFVVLVATFVLHAEQQLHDFLIKALDQAAAMSSPEVQSTLQSLHAPEGFATLVVAFIISALLTSIIFSALGCIIGAVLFRERNRPTF